MTNCKPTAAEIKENLEIKLSRFFGCTAAEASKDQIYKATAMTIRDILTEKRGSFKKKVNQAGGKRVYYMCLLHGLSVLPGLPRYRLFYLL